MTMLQPEAFVTVKKNRLKLYEHKNHYLKSKTNFEIELFNPTNESVLAKIWLNDKLMSASGIIIKAGQRVYLERFLDTPEKFQFNVFEVDDVKETQAAREKNGLVKVSFFSKIMPNLLLNSGTTSTTIYPNTLTYTSTTSNPYNIIAGSPSMQTINTAYYSNTVNTFAGPNIRSAVITDSVETGRVGKGGKSKQEFKQEGGKYSDYSFSNWEFQLLPESAKPVETSEIRNYCNECGIRIRKSSWKFCPNCGAEL
jgi:hypothetical protein